MCADRASLSQSRQFGCVGKCLVCNITSMRAPRPFFLRTRAASYLPSFSLFLSHSHSHSLSLSPSKLSKASPVKLSIRRRLQRRSASGVVSSAISYHQSPLRASVLERALREVSYLCAPPMGYRASPRPRCGAVSTRPRCGAVLLRAPHLNLCSATPRVSCDVVGYLPLSM